MHLKNPINSYRIAQWSKKYEDLKFLSRQYSQRITYVAKLKVQLIALLDQTMPGITKNTATEQQKP